MLNVMSNNYQANFIVNVDQAIDEDVRLHWSVSAKSKNTFADYILRAYLRLGDVIDHFRK